MSQLGRPSSYNAKIAEKMKDLMAQGFSFNGAAGKLKLSNQTLKNWYADKDEFTDAVDTGKRMRIAALEEELLFRSDKGPEVTKYICLLQAADPAEYRNTKSQLEVSGPGGAPVQTDNTFIIKYVDTNHEADKLLEIVDTENAD